MCGTPIASNPSNMCVNCVRSQVDITDGIPKQLVLQWCKACGRFDPYYNSIVQADLTNSDI